MIFFLSSLIFASALEYPSWGDWQYGPEMITYSQFIPQPGCASTPKCAPLIDKSFNGGELDLCLRSAKKGCTFIARPSTSRIQGVDLIYDTWEDNGNVLAPPNWETGCSAKTTGGYVYATSIQLFQDYFATIPTDDFDLKGEFFEMTLNERIDNEKEFELYLGNNQDLSKGCANVKLEEMTKVNLAGRWIYEGYEIKLPFDDVIGNNTLATRFTGTWSKETTSDSDKSPKRSEWSFDSRAPNLDRMSFRSDRFLAFFKGSDSAYSDSATSAISLSLLSLAFVTLIM